VAEAIAHTEGLGAFNNSIYTFDAKGVLIGTAVRVLLLFVIIVISTPNP
jgi:high-affinity nickel permease